MSENGFHPSQLGIDRRVAVVTGGTSGIGKAIALGYAKVGATVVATGRTVPKVAAVSGEIRALGSDTIEMPCDVTQRNEIEHLADAAVDKFGKIDILVNSAGANLRKPALDYAEEEWDAIVDTNLKGTFLASQVFAGRMKDKGYGRIINIASVTSFLAIVNTSPYAASKGGVITLTKTFAREWAKYGINVNAIAPGFIVTDFNRQVLMAPERQELIFCRTPQKRYGTVDDMIGPAIFLASEAAAHVTGATLAVDGGFTSTGV
ncbi:SDR family NAD(P)-dependent oxidoreductase [Candidatus Hydrogenedentota bacterium]